MGMPQKWSAPGPKPHASFFLLKKRVWGLGALSYGTPILFWDIVTYCYKFLNYSRKSADKQWWTSHEANDHHSNTRQLEKGTGKG